MITIARITTNATDDYKSAELTFKGTLTADDIAQIIADETGCDPSTVTVEHITTQD